MAFEYFYDRGLPGTVGAEQGEDLPMLDAEIHATNGLH
jgi:hypothetical protein